jgi:hypothetical protein
MSAAQEAKLPPSLDGSVVLDIGGDIGALVLVTGPELLGEELELTPTDPGRKRVHTEVRERIVAGRRRFAAVYPQLAAGEYVLDCNRQPVAIRGGEITEIALAVGALSRIGV